MSCTPATNGRLGNQIIRNIAVAFIARKHDLSVEYSNLSLINSLGIQLYIGTNVYDNMIKLTDENFMELLNGDALKSNVDSTVSYFQSKEITNMIYEWLNTRDVRSKIVDANPYTEIYNKNNDCFVHIRLKDVAHLNPGLDYYTNALSKLSFDRLYIASDDYRHPIVSTIMRKYPNTYNVNLDEVNTIRFGSTCKHVVLSHGSFSAIIGYLSFFSDVYYPKYGEVLWHGDMFSIPGWNMVSY